ESVFLKLSYSCYSPNWRLRAGPEGLVRGLDYQGSPRSEVYIVDPEVIACGLSTADETNDHL
ncbi:unnamed protein product, partial [marine sediment metagenome]